MAFSFHKDLDLTRHEFDASAFREVSHLEAFQDCLASVVKDFACQGTASYHQDQGPYLVVVDQVRQVRERREGCDQDLVVLGDRPCLEGYHQGRFPLEGYSCPNQPPVEPSPDHSKDWLGLLAVWPMTLWVPWDQGGNWMAEAAAGFPAYC